MKDIIPLSYNPIDSIALHEILQRYEGVNHVQIVTDFESEIAKVTGSKFVLAVNSGTAAIHLGLRALGVGQDDEVFTSTFTYVGTVNPILYEKAIPVFIDSEDKTWNMDPELLEKAIKRSKKPKAILVVHSYGMPAQMDEILFISKKYSIPILEDAAEAVGSRYKSRHLGTFGEVGVFSFNNNKIATTFGGGAVITQNEAIYRKIKYWASQSLENKPFYEHKEIGFSYKMGSINAAVGLASFKELDNRILSSRRKYEWYKGECSGNQCVFVNEPLDFYSNRWLSTMLVKSGSADLRSFLKSEAVETRPFWNPMHKQPVFEHFPNYCSGFSEELFKQGICLPSSYTLSENQQIRVIDLIRKYLA